LKFNFFWAPAHDVTQVGPVHGGAKITFSVLAPSDLNQITPNHRQMKAKTCARRMAPVWGDSVGLRQSYGPYKVKTLIFEKYLFGAPSRGAARGGPTSNHENKKSRWAP